MLSAVYAMFFLSGAAALIYQVAWIRSLSLVFGGSHLAVATVLTVFMTGLAIGSYTIGKRVDKYLAPLRLYAYLELGIAACALLFVAMLKMYPPVYIYLAQFAPASPMYLSCIRIVFAIIALIIPTSLMGGTLPVLAVFFSRQTKTEATRLSLLYGFNTMGAVVGASAAGFFFLRYFSVSSTMAVAVAINVAVALVCFFIQSRASKAFDSHEEPAGEIYESVSESQADAATAPMFSLKLVLWGIGVSGFCALGYEVLWTRVLSIVVGASTYGFTIMLVAFLSGIACGSTVYGFLSGFVERLRGSGPGKDKITTSIAAFGLIQIAIGVTALIVSIKFIDLPVNKPLLMKYFLSRQYSMFDARLWANISLSFAYMFIPALFMGMAFPLAGKVHSAYRRHIGQTVGEVLSYNTIGAILGSAFSGFVMIYLIGIERSLQILVIINIGFGLLVLFSLLNRKTVNRGVFLASVGIIALLVFNPGLWRIWDTRWLAVYKTNELEPYYTREIISNMVRNTEVLYYGEGAEAIVSAVGSGAYQGFITNGRTESSNTPVDLQCVYTLGHLPMLLAHNPKNIFVLGTGAGMTLGATSVYPSVEKITLVEIEPKVLGVARTFSRYNHNVLDNPKLNIVFNDGRNFLMTSREKYDVITADPIHPWFSGAGYLYTSEYFKLASEHLNPGGIICQWLPIYELTNDNLRSVVNTFRANFKYSMIWLTQYDIELVGSNTPIILDEDEIARRIAIPEVARDLALVKMGTAEDFLSYFMMGDTSLKSYSASAMVNTDDNVYLEFSAPLSVGKTGLVADNIQSLSRFRESIVPYLKKPDSAQEQLRQRGRWGVKEKAAAVADRLHAVYYRNDKEFEYVTLMRQMEQQFPGYAPYKIMHDEYKQTYRY